MNKKILRIDIILLIILAILIGVAIYIANFNSTNNKISTNTISNNNNVTNNTNNTLPEQEESNNNLNLPTSGNDYVITTKSKTSIRVINEYDDKMFSKDKNLLIMFGTWCPNCQEEISEIEKIIDYFKNNKNINVIVIAHEYEETVNDLINLVENDVDFQDIEVKLDLSRIIRKTIDPEASTVPMSYVVDKKGNILKKHDTSTTLQDAIQMVK